MSGMSNEESLQRHKQLADPGCPVCHGEGVNYSNENTAFGVESVWRRCECVWKAMRAAAVVDTGEAQNG